MNFSLTQRAVIALSIMLPFVILCLVTSRRIFYSLTPSLPYTLFWLSPVNAGQEIDLGTYIMFTAPKSYSVLAGVNLHDSAKAMKQVRCKEGQTLIVRERKFFCDNFFIGEAKEKTRSGLPLAEFVFNGVIPHGKLFVMGSHRDSYDSRYIGFIERAAVEATGTPLI
jgi:signal peptidase I/conjugal transfer pilin signal peptidase TrbI